MTDIDIAYIGGNDLYKLWINDSGHKGCTICSVKGDLASAKGMVFQAWVHEQVPLQARSQGGSLGAKEPSLK